MQYKTVIYEKNKNIATITLNQPGKLNAWDFPGQGGQSDDFYAALKETAQDDDVKVVIIRGAGKAFSAGHDLDTVGFVYGMGTGKPGEKRASQRTRLKIDREWWYGRVMGLLYHPKITVCQVHGYCLGEGQSLVEMSDISIAADDAQFGHTEQRLGFAGTGGPMLPLIYKVGLGRARELLLTGRLFSAAEAERIGLVSRIVPQDKLEEEVRKLAAALSLLPKDGIAIGKAGLHATYNAMGMSGDAINAYMTHTLFTNLVYDEGEWVFFKERRNKGTKAAFKERDKRYDGLV
ncbi:MAG: enoyl-CoA hydratase/isomerase family protein [Chloroflexi bacterium]|nr:enoyl-CoA hydratase/isomerase family protein [Chloroflexota bacterium]